MSADGFLAPQELQESTGFYRHWINYLVLLTAGRHALRERAHSSVWRGTGLQG